MCSSSPEIGFPCRSSLVVCLQRLWVGWNSVCVCVCARAHVHVCVRVWVGVSTHVGYWSQSAFPVLCMDWSDVHSLFLYVADVITPYCRCRHESLWGCLAVVMFVPNLMLPCHADAHEWEDCGPVCVSELFFFLSYNSPSSAFIYLFSHRAYGILVPRPGIKPVPFSVEAESLNSWAAREVPVSELFYQEGLFCWPRLERWCHLTYEPLLESLEQTLSAHEVGMKVITTIRRDPLAVLRAGLAPNPGLPPLRSHGWLPRLQPASSVSAWKSENLGQFIQVESVVLLS